MNKLIIFLYLLAAILAVTGDPPDVEYILAEPTTAALLGAAAIKGGAELLGGLIGHKTQKATNATNLQIARETNELNYKMFNEGNEWNERVAKEMLKANQDYNSPVTQMALMREAGINPNVAASEGLVGQASSSQSAPTSMSVPQMVTPHIENPWSSAVDSMRGLADVFAKISESGKTDAETEEIKKTIADHVRQAKAAADAQEWQNHVAKIFDVGDRQQAYNAAVEAYKNLCQDTLNKVKEGQLVDEKILTEQYTWMNKMADQVLKQKQSEKLDIELKHYEKKYLAEIDEIKSKINANNASAADSYSHVAVNKSQVDVNRAMEIDLKAAAKLSDAEMQSLAQEIVGAYIDETGMHVDPEKRAQVQHEIEKQLRYETKQHRQDYFNPFRIVGNLLGPAASVYHTSVLKKVIK